MNLTKSARYALYAALEMAADPGRAITVGEVARRYRVPAGALAKVFQQMVRAGLAVGTRGVGGGYRLSRGPSRITLLDVMNAFQPPRPAGRCLLAELPEDCAQSHACRLREVFDEVDEVSRNTFASISLETLAGPSARAAEAPLARIGRSRGAR
jgi:Rrf2 family protein